MALENSGNNTGPGSWGGLRNPGGRNEYTQLLRQHWPEIQARAAQIRQQSGNPDPRQSGFGVSYQPEQQAFEEITGHHIGNDIYIDRNSVSFEPTVSTFERLGDAFSASAGALGGALALPAAAGSAGTAALPAASTAPATGSLAPGLAPSLDLGAGETAAVAGSAALPAAAGGIPDFHQTVEGVTAPDTLPSTSTVPPFGSLPPGLDPNLLLGGDSNNVMKTIGKWAKLLSGLGAGISGATDQAAQNRIARNDPYVQRGRLEMDQRQKELQRMASADYAFNPVHSPFDPVAARMPSDPYASVLRNLQGQDSAALATPPQYDTSKFPSIEAGTTEQIGNWAGPILRVLGYLGSGK